MSLPMIRADWAQHMVYGAWVGAAGAAGVLVIAQVAGRPEMGLMAPVGGLWAALVAGLAKELADWLANRRVMSDVLLWQLDRPATTPHEVSAADVVATVAGALPVAVPLFLSMWR
jgi:hypothetical protein